MNHNLCAAEILVLQEPNKPLGREAFKVALKELLALKLVKLEKDKPFGSRKQVTNLIFSPQQPIKNPSLLAVYNVLRSNANGHSIELDKALQAAQRQFGNGYFKFQSQILLPTLVSRGLIESYPAKVLGIFSTTRYRHTHEGARLASQIQIGMYRSKNITSMLKDNPQEVAALVVSLGSAALLVPALWPHFTEINNVVRQQVADGTASFGSDIGYFGGEDNRYDFDLSDAESAMSELDSSFDSSDGGDGGGDGGGGGE